MNFDKKVLINLGIVYNVSLLFNLRKRSCSSVSGFFFFLFFCTVFIKQLIVICSRKTNRITNRRKDKTFLFSYFLNCQCFCGKKENSFSRFGYNVQSVTGPSVTFQQAANTNK